MRIRSSVISEDGFPWDISTGSRTASPAGASGGGRRRADAAIVRWIRAAAAAGLVGSAAAAVLLGWGMTGDLAAAGASASPPSLVYVGNHAHHGVNAFALSASGNVKPTVALTLSPTLGHLVLAFDGQGNLWAGNGYTESTITELGSTQLVSSGSRAPSVTITAHDVAGLAFTGNGDLWAADHATSVLTRYTPAQLAVSGNPTPVVQLTSDGSTPASIDGPENMAVDASGDLWVANALNNTIVEFTPTQLTASGSPTPKVTISSVATSLRYPVGLAISSSGDLWVSNKTPVKTSSLSTLVEYTPAQLAAGGAVTPATVISTIGTSPWSIGFTSSGSLWVVLFGGSLDRFSPSALVPGGVPTAVISGSTTQLTFPHSIAFKAPPTVTSVAPITGQATGKTSVTIHGTGFTSATKVEFGDVPASTVRDVSPFTVTAVVPPGTGVVDVTATTYGGTSVPSAGATYRYLGATGKGYWEVAADGGIFAFTAPSHGSMGGKALNAPVVGMTEDPATGGYWEVAADGGIFSFTAPFLGSMGGKPLNSPVVGMAPTPTGQGYWLVAADGGIFSFGTAVFHGSMGGSPLNSPVVGMAPTPTGQGYWLVAADGGIFAFTAPFHGSMAGRHLNGPVVGMTEDPATGGYWLVAADGGVFAFTAPFLGSMGGKSLNSPVVGIGVA
ncbi:MAG: IPT/TIG domain-containing protein [Acidimicrobiales bacterium]